LVWEILGDFYSADTKKAIAAYATALSCKSPKEFLVKVKEKLAELLIQQEYLNHAKTEIEELVATRQSHQWRLTSKVNNWQKSSWYNNTNGCLNNYEFFRDQKN
jgi:L-lactate utilization protein LutC